VPLICVNLPARSTPISAFARERASGVRSRVLISLTCLPLLSSAQTLAVRRRRRVQTEKHERSAEAAPEQRTLR